MRTNLTCSVRDSGSTVSGTGNLSHQLLGAGNNMASAEVLVDSNSYAEGRASYQISIFVRSGSEGLTEPPDAKEYTSVSKVHVEQTFMSVAAAPMVASGNLTLVKAELNVGASLTGLNLTIGNKTISSINQASPPQTTVPFGVDVSQPSIPIAMDVTMECNSGNETEAEGRAVFLINLQCGQVAGDIQPIVVIDADYFERTLLAEGKSAAAHQ